MKKQIVLLGLSLFISLESWGVTELPTSSFSRLPDVSSLRLSPDGKHIASIERIEQQGESGTIIRLRNIENSTNKGLAVTDNKKYVVKWIRWGNNEELLVSAVFPAVRYGVRVTETRLLVLNTKSGKITPILSQKYFERQGWVPQYLDSVIDILPDDPSHILLNLRAKGGNSWRAVKARLGRAGSPKVQQSVVKNVHDWITDRQHRVRIGTYFKDTTTKILVRDVGQKKWRTLWEYEVLSENEVVPLGFSENPNILYYQAYHEGRLAIFKADVSNSNLKAELVYSSPHYDVNGRLLYSRKNKKVIGLSHDVERGYTFWDEDYLLMQKSLDKVLPATENQFYDMSSDETRMIVLSTSDTDAGTYYLWDRPGRSLQALALRYASLDPENMVAKKKINYLARDGLEIEAFLTRPDSADSKMGPAVIFPHGGPISSDGFGFDYWTQFFANRGYTVLQMNFRGSAGYGFDFMKLGLGSWGLQMQNDVEDGTRWLIEKGIADPDKICIVGASYGGYAALMEAANNSDLYQCAISFAGVTDLPYLVSSSRRFVGHDVVKKQIGSDKKSLRERSPTSRADEIDIPVLLAHGSKDRVVRVQHGRRMSDKLKKAGKNVRYIELKGGTHYLGNEERRVQLFDAMDEFLKTYLN